MVHTQVKRKRFSIKKRIKYADEKQCLVQEMIREGKVNRVVIGTDMWTKREVKLCQKILEA